MNDLHFENPQALHLIWLVVGAVAFLVWRDRQGAGRLNAFVSLVMRRRLVTGPNPARRLGGIGLFGLAGLCLVAALVGPQWGLIHVEATRVGAEIMVCLDVSKSMLAEDVAPNRLRRAKAEVADLIALLDTDHVGLIAFAGRASVLCPMTPDDAFLRLVLDSAGPHSVSRGGTNLEAPIRKAMDAFHGKEDSARVILLITDGEDHDSFAMDAAREAREKGVKIIAIGLGDENGSRIEITNPQTGAREPVRDRDGNVVISKLDGRMLREIALATEGVYVPAGTGALDLLDIYERHIEPLMRSSLDSRGITLRHEAFQYPLLGALVLTLLGAGVATSVPRKRKPARATINPSKAALIALALGLFCVNPTHAQPMRDGLATPPTVNSPVLDIAPQNDPIDDTPTGNETVAAPEVAEDVEPRELYNGGLTALESGNLDEAQRLFAEARLEAGPDGQLRYQATYNLAWVDVRRADAQLESAPEDALKALRSAADWFANASRLRPNITEVRENLEIVLLRIMRLADALNKTDESDLAARLDALIESQRGALSVVSDATRLAAELEGQTESLREDFAHLAADQLAVISEAQSLIDTAYEESDTLRAIEEDQRTPDQAVRLAQLGGVLHYLGSASQKMTQGRSQLRRRQAQRAFLRAAGSLEQLKRAAEQLADPTQVLAGLIADGEALGRQTRVLSQSTLALNLDTPNAPSPPPAWLTLDYLRELQDQLGQRTRELHTRLDAGLTQMRQNASQPQPATGPGQPPVPGQPDPQQQERFIEALTQAVPLIDEAGQSFERALGALDAESAAVGVGATGALGYQTAGLDKLKEAREYFLDMRALIELTYAQEVTLQQELDGAEGVVLAMSMPSLRAKQAKNIDRAGRLKTMLDDARQAVEQQAAQQPSPPAPQGSAAPDPAEDPAAAERERLTLANQLLEGAVTDMRSAAEALRAWEESGGAGRGDGEGDAIVARATTGVDAGVEKLQALRRLFFSIVEHLRETLQRQVQLNDETAALVGQTDANLVEQTVGPLQPRQAELAALAEAIALALRQQATQNPADFVANPDDPTPDGRTAQQQQESQAMAERFAQAADKVDEGQVLMTAADAKLTEAANPPPPVPPVLPAAPDLTPVRDDQDGAAQRLAEALALLQPPQENQDPQQGDDQQQQQDQQDQQDQQQQQQQQAGAQQGETGDRDVDTSGLLQSIRDREQQRERDRQRRPAGGYEPVEKDW